MKIVFRENQFEYQTIYYGKFCANCRLILMRFEISDHVGWLVDSFVPLNGTKDLIELRFWGILY